MTDLSSLSRKLNETTRNWTKGTQMLPAITSPSSWSSFSSLVDTSASRRSHSAHQSPAGSYVLSTRTSKKSAGASTRRLTFTAVPHSSSARPPFAASCSTCPRFHHTGEKRRKVSNPPTHIAPPRISQQVVAECRAGFLVAGSDNSPKIEAVIQSADAVASRRRRCVEALRGTSSKSNKPVRAHTHTQSFVHDSHNSNRSSLCVFVF